MTDVASRVGATVGGRYKLVRVIGEGAMSAVYEGEHIHMHKPFAVKVLRPEMTENSEAVARFEREAMAASRIDHPNVAGATDFGALEDGAFFLVLELVSGRTLRAVIADGRLPATRALHVLGQIASALARAHALGIVHRDLKPENVMLTKRGEEEDVVKILDFGIAKVPPEAPSPGAPPPVALTKVGLVYGTPEYMSPEQAMGKSIDASTDLYALGVMLFEMLAGVRPWDDENKVVLLGKHVGEPVPAIADKAPGIKVRPEVEAIVRKLMGKTPAERYASANDLVAAIDAVPPEPAPAAAPQLKTLPLPAKEIAAKPARPFAPWKRVAVHLIERAEARLPLDRLPFAIAKRDKLWLVMGSIAFLLMTLVVVTTVVIVALSKGKSAASTNGPSAAVDHHARCMAAAAAGDHATVVREADAWATANPYRVADDIARAVGDAAVDQETPAFDLLEKKLGSAGVDTLYDLAYGPSSTNHADIATHAKRSLQDDTVKAKMSSALVVTLGIRTSTNICDAKTKYFAQAATTGDARTADTLTPYLKRAGCGRHGRVDCHPCLRTGNDSVEKTVAAIKARGDGGQ